MRNALLAAASIAALLVSGCGSGSDQGGDQSKQGITIYSGRIAPLIGPLIDIYEEQTGIDVKTRFGSSSDLASTIIEEGDNSPADLFFAQEAGSLGAVQDTGLLARLPRSLLARVPEEFQSGEGRWVGATARARVIAYGPDVKPADLPASVLDLTDQRWRGRVGWAPTNASFQAFVTALRLTQGEDVARQWLEGMVANDTKPYENNILVRDAIADGELDLGLINHYYVAEAKAEDPDYPVELYSPPGDIGSMINVAGIGVLASSERPAEALDFVRFLLGRRAQSFFAESSKEYPVAAGVEADPSLVPLTQIPNPAVDLTKIDDLQGTLELLQETGAL